MYQRAALAVLALLLAVACGEQSPTAPDSVSRQTRSETSPTPPPVPPTHTLTITASPSCTSLPEEALRRTYAVQVQEKPDGYIVVLVVNSDGSMIGWANAPGFEGKREGNTVLFDIIDDLFAPYAMIERIGIGDMGYFGDATGTIDDNDNIVATFDGEYRLGYGKGPVLCAAADHHIELTRIGSSAPDRNTVP